jgi:TetR/AcrR family transcriptional regulator
MDGNSHHKGGRTRDAERSRQAILREAARLFAAEGFDAVSLVRIAAAAGLSRGTPNYFYGSKDKLYVAVLEEAFASRERATRHACRPLLEWADAPAGSSLAAALNEAVQGYIDFLLSHPDFSRLIQREEFDGATRLRAVPRESMALDEAFGAVRSVGPERGIRPFDVEDAVLLFVALTFLPVALRDTFMASLGRDLGDEKVRRAHTELVVDQLLRLLHSG